MGNGISRVYNLQSIHLPLYICKFIIITNLVNLLPRLSLLFVVAYDKLLVSILIRIMHLLSLSYLQSVFVSAKELGLVELLGTNQYLKSLICQCCAIPLAPHDLMKSALIAIGVAARGSTFYSLLRPLLQSIWTTWLTGQHFEAREISVSDSIHCTSNAFEIFQNMLENQQFRKCQDIFKLIGKVIRILLLLFNHCGQWAIIDLNCRLSTTKLTFQSECLHRVLWYLSHGVRSGIFISLTSLHIYVFHS